MKANTYGSPQHAGPCIILYSITENGKKMNELFKVSKYIFDIAYQIYRRIKWIKCDIVWNEFCTAIIVIQLLEWKCCGPDRGTHKLFHSTFIERAKKEWFPISVEMDILSSEVFWVGQHQFLLVVILFVGERIALNRKICRSPVRFHEEVNKT